MDEHIAVLNEYAAKEQEKLSIRKRISGYKLMKTIYHWIGNYFNLPNDMCYEIGSYLMYLDEQSTIYQEHCQRNYYFFLYKEIVSCSLLLMSRHEEILYFDDNDDAFNCWQLKDNASMYDIVFDDEDYVMDACHCYTCGNYRSSMTLELHPRIQCLCLN